jgi:hypothetical protein
MDEGSEKIPGSSGISDAIERANQVSGLNEKRKGGKQKGESICINSEQLGTMDVNGLNKIKN